MLGGEKNPNMERLYSILCFPGVFKYTGQWRLAPRWGLHSHTHSQSTHNDTGFRPVALRQKVPIKDRFTRSGDYPSGGLGLPAPPGNVNPPFCGPRGNSFRMPEVMAATKKTRVCPAGEATWPWLQVKCQRSVSSPLRTREKVESGPCYRQPSSVSSLLEHKVDIGPDAEVCRAARSEPFLYGPSMGTTWRDQVRPLTTSLGSVKC